MNNSPKEQKPQSNTVDKLKLWCVRRWLHLVPFEELRETTERRLMYQQMNEVYEKLLGAMLENYYSHSDETAQSMWQYHLQRMVIAEDRIKYLNDNIKK